MKNDIRVMSLQRRCRFFACAAMVAFLLTFLTNNRVRAGGCTGVNISYTVKTDFCNNQFCIEYNAYAEGLHGNEVFHIDFGDGNWKDTVPGAIGNANVKVVACYTYAGAGTYTVTLTVTPAHVSCVVSTEVTFGSFVAGTDVSCDGGSDGAVNLNVPNNNPPYTYLWSDGSTNEDRSGLSAGTYTVTITDGSGCTRVETVVVDEPAPIDVTLNYDCNAGTASTTVTGGTQYIPITNPYLEDFSGYSNGSTVGYGTPPDWTAMPYVYNAIRYWEIRNGAFSGYYLGGEYWWRSKCIDISGCTNVRISIDISNNGADAFWGDYLKLYYNIGGGDVLLWTKVDNSQMGAYPTFTTFTSNIPNGTCVEIVVRATLTFDYYYFDNIRVDCDPLSTEPYFYQWCTGATTPTATGIPNPGSCQVIVTDANGCTAVKTLNCNIACDLALTTSKTDVLCPGDCDGTATVNATTTANPSAYAWSNGATTASVSGLCAGNYSVTVTDANSCQETAVVTISEPAPVTLSTIVTPVLCTGNCDGTASVNASGGTPGYTYNWSSGGTGAGTSGLCAGTYTVTVTDANNCQKTTTVTVIEPLPVVPSATATPALCAGSCDGSVLATATGGTPGYNFTWSGGGTDSTATGLCAGTYSVTVTDKNGCTATTSATVTEPPPIVLTPSSTPASCGMTDGSACVSAAGGTPGYTYLWSDANSTKTTCLNGLSSGTYTVTVTDNNGCRQTVAISVSSFAGPTATSTSTGASCPGACDGSGTVTASDGTPGYTYAWPGGGTDAAKTGLCAGSYTVTVMDLNGCQVMTTLTVTEPTPVVPVASATPALCAGSCDGSASVSATGGTPGYTYTWSSGASGTSATGLCAGTYTVTASDANGCTATATATVTEPTPVVPVASAADVLCAGDCNGSATVTASGGTPGYTYSWSSGASGTNATGLCAGTYTVTATDANGCVQTTTATVNEPPPLIVASGPDLIICPGTTPASDLTVTASGGTPGYFYQWDDPGSGTTATITVTNVNNTTVTYNVTVTDANGCTQIEQITVVSVCAPIVVLPPDSFCLGSCATLNALTAGGLAPYTYTWSDPTLTGDGPHTVCPTQTTTYSVTVTDANGKSADTTVAIIVFTPPAVTMSNTSAQCGVCDGTATVSATGNSPFAFIWDNGQTTAAVTGLCAGSYSATVTDARGCVDSATVDVSAFGSPGLTVAGTHVLCAGDNSGTVDVTPSGGTPPYTYIWNNGASTEDLSGLAGGNYRVTVTDSIGCPATISFTVSEPTPLVLGLLHTDATCNGDSDGTANLNVSGATPPYGYQWSNGGTDQDITGLTAGTYTVTVTDANGCTGVISQVITEPPPIVLSIIPVDALCGQSNGSAAASVAAGGVTPFSYIWNTGSSLASLTGLNAGTFTVTITDARGCSEIISAIVAAFGVPDAVITDSADVTCFGLCDGSATVQGSGGTPPYTYQWIDAGGQTTAQVTGLCPGTYHVCVIDSLGCPACTEVTISEPPPVVLTTDSVPERCSRSDGSVTVNASGGTPGYTYIWNDAGSQTTATATGLPAGTYTVTVADANGCTAATSVAIGNTPPPVAVFAGMDVCQGGTTNFTYGSTGNIISCSWDFGDGKGTSTVCGNVSYSYDTAGTYTVTLIVADTYGCPDTTTGTVIVHPPPVVCFTDSLTGCVPLTATFRDCSVNGGACLWDFGDKTTSTDCNPTHVFTRPGCYDISLTVTSPYGCSASLKKDCYVEGYPLPYADFIADPWEVSILSPLVYFIDKSTNAVRWVWSFGDGDSAYIQHPIHTYQDTGCYPVTLVLTNQYGCVDTSHETICVKDWPSIYVPNAFTPNGDGKNELFNIKHLGFCECEMYIFDRWGNEIYKMNDCTNGSIGWDGTANNGENIQQEDVYVWLILARDCYEGKPWRRIGQVTLIR